MKNLVFVIIALGSLSLYAADKPTSIKEFEAAYQVKCETLGGSQGYKSIRIALCKGDGPAEYVVRQTKTERKSKLKIKECAYGTYQSDSFYGDAVPKCSSGREVEVSN